VAADDIPPTSHAVALTNVFRPDVVVPPLPLEAVLAGAPRSGRQVPGAADRRR
jgi:aspartyl-tRNA(Asn)/glutamyl-tRNA(Gln) amidotransferase subunit C